MKLTVQQQAIDFRYDRMLIEQRRDARKKRRALRVVMRRMNRQNWRVNELLRNSPR